MAASVIMAVSVILAVSVSAILIKSMTMTPVVVLRGVACPLPETLTEILMIATAMQPWRCRSGSVTGVTLRNPASAIVLAEEALTLTTTALDTLEATAQGRLLLLPNLDREDTIGRRLRVGTRGLLLRAGMTGRPLAGTIDHLRGGANCLLLRREASLAEEALPRRSTTMTTLRRGVRGPSLTPADLAPTGPRLTAVGHRRRTARGGHPKLVATPCPR